MTCRSKRTCQPATSGWPAPAGLFLAALATVVLDVKCVASVVLAVFGPRRAACCTCLPTNPFLNFGGNGAEEWWKVSARTMRTVCRSCFNQERSRRSRRRLAAPVSRSPCSDMSTAKVFLNSTQKGKLRWKTTWWWWWCVFVCGEVRTDDLTNVFVDKRQWMHLIMEAVSLWTRPPALYMCTGPEKSPLSKSEHCNCGTGAVFCAPNHPAPVVAHNGRVNDLVQARKRRVQLWELGCLSTSARENCVGCDIVQADHAPEAGVAQGIFHGILVRHQGKHQEEVEEGLEEDVERRVKREHSSNQTQVRMHG